MVFICGLMVVLFNLGAPSRIEKLVDSLKKHSINRPDASTLQRISRDDKLLDFGSINTECAYDICRRVEEIATTATKSFIGKTLNLYINNGPISDDYPNIFSARDETSFKMVKILRVGGGGGG